MIQRCLLLKQERTTIYMIRADSSLKRILQIQAIPPLLTSLTSQQRTGKVKTYILLLLCFPLLFISCKGQKQVANGPGPCISEKINTLSDRSYRIPPRIVQYKYNGGTVYYIPPLFPDGFSDLLDSACNMICHPDGGITGKGDGKCKDFFTSRTDEKVIWKKE
jgi:hypothetical protein